MLVLNLRSYFTVILFCTLYDLQCHVIGAENIFTHIILVGKFHNITNFRNLFWLLLILLWLSAVTSATPTTTTPKTNTPTTTTTTPMGGSPYVTTPNNGGVLGGVGTGLGPSGVGINNDDSHGGLKLQQSTGMFSLVVVHIVFLGLMFLWG